MDAQTAADTIRTRFKTLVQDPESLETVYDNAPAVNPTDESETNTGIPAEDSLWARVTIIDGESNQITLGQTSKRFRTTGVMVVQLFAPLGTGDGEVRRLGAFVRSQFLSISAGGIVWRTPSVSAVGQSNRWWQVNVTCPFYYDELV